ncbi:MFS transporter [Streptomyces jumonjinensis]|uniref:MFS transporter n=1 Tax=Streptomyces jumonjinensis TaxID=1945 RepID=UPI0018865C80|nr:MFS transporter [Streptomyces jumonjinensis]
MTQENVRTAEPRDQPSRSRFAIFFGGKVFSLMGDGLAFLAVPLVVLQLTDDPFAAALAAAPRTVGYLLFGLIAGAIVDRLNPRLIMLTTDIVRFSAFLALALLAQTGLLQVWMALVLAFAASGAGVFFDTALAVAVRDLVRGERLLRANSWLETTNQASLVVGPGVFGLLSATVGLHAALFGNAATYLLSLVTVFVVAGPGATPAPGRPAKLAGALRGLRQDVADGLRFLRGARLILLLTCLQTTANFFIAVGTLTPFYAKNFLGLSDAALGVVVGLGGLGGLLGAIAAPRLAVPVRQLAVVVVSAGCLGLGLAGMGLVGGLVPLAALNLVVSGGSILAVVVIRSIRQELVPREMLGRVTATARTAALMAGPVGAMAAGLLAGMNGGDPRPVFLCFGLMVVTCTVLVWFAGLREYAGRSSLDGVAAREQRPEPEKRHERAEPETR